MLALHYDNTKQRADFLRDGGNLLTDEGLETLVTMSLFTNDLSRPEDGVDERGGWWAAPFFDTKPPGSRLWTLARATATADRLREAERMAEDALAWLVDNKIVLKVEATAELGDGFVRLHIVLTKPDNAGVFERAWEVTFNALS